MPRRPAVVAGPASRLPDVILTQKKSPNDGAVGLRECSTMELNDDHYPFSQAARKG